MNTIIAEINKFTNQILIHTHSSGIGTNYISLSLCFGNCVSCLSKLTHRKAMRYLFFKTKVFEPMQIIYEDSSNYRCIDCDSIHITHTSLTFNISICETCAGIQISIAHTDFQLRMLNESSLEIREKILFAVNNASFNEKYEKYVPWHYKKITPSSASILKFNWIKSKYIDMSFIKYALNPPSHYWSGFVYISDKCLNIYKQRWLEIVYNEGIICYYDIEKKCKCAINIHEIDLNFVPSKIGIDTGLQIDFLEDGFTKSIYVYTLNETDVIDCYHTLRFCKLSILQRNLLHCDKNTLVELISSEIVKEGTIKKSGPTKIHRFRSRWFTLLRKKNVSTTAEWFVRYYENPLDFSPKGEIALGRKSQGFNISYSKENEQYDVTLILSTPTRIFNLIIESRFELDSWKEHFEVALR